MYRYKLTDNEKNKDFEKRSVQGIILGKNEWYFSRQKVDKLERYLKDIVTEDYYNEVLEQNQKLVQDNIEKEKVKLLNIEREKVDTEYKEKQEAIREKLRKEEEIKKLDIIIENSQAKEYYTWTKIQMVEEIIKLNPEIYQKSHFKGMSKDEIYQTLIQVSGAYNTKI